MISEKEKMLSGELYDSSDEELSNARNAAQKFTRLYNATTEEEQNRREELLRSHFGKVGGKIYIEPNFRCDYAFNIFVGDNFYANYDCIMLDICRITIGANCLIGPRVCIYTATHPVAVGERISRLEYAKPVTIGDNVWIGGNAVINPGVTIGDNAVVASGSVVIRDVESNVVVAGNPAKVVKRLSLCKQGL